MAQQPQPGAGTRQKSKNAAIGAGIVLILIVVTLVIALVQPGSGPAGRATVAAATTAATDPLPAFVYQSGDTLEMRQGAAAPQTLATLPSGDPVTDMAWSWNGAYLAYITGPSWWTQGELHVVDVATDTSNAWPCPGCARAAFQGSYVLADDMTDQLLTFPVDGGAENTITVNGLPTTQGAMIGLLGSTPGDAAVVFYVCDEAAGSGDSFLYTTDISGNATQLGNDPAVIVPATEFNYYSAPTLISTSPDHTVLAYGGNGIQDADCSANDSVTVADLDSDTVTTVPLPETDGGTPRVAGVWIDASDTVYASVWSQSPSGCDGNYDLAPQDSSPLEVYELVGATWQPANAATAWGSGGPNGWTATTPGTVSVALGSSPSGMMVTVDFGSLSVSSGNNTIQLGTSGPFSFAPASS